MIDEVTATTIIGYTKIAAYSMACWMFVLGVATKNTALAQLRIIIAIYFLLLATLWLKG